MLAIANQPARMALECAVCVTVSHILKDNFGCNVDKFIKWNIIRIQSKPYYFEVKVTLNASFRWIPITIEHKIQPNGHFPKGLKTNLYRFVFLIAELFNAILFRPKTNIQNEMNHRKTISTK